MSLFRQVAKNTLSQAGGRTVVVFLTVAITAFLTRLLGVSGYGNYVFLVSLLMFFVTVADWGTGLISVREAVKKKEVEKKFYFNAFLLRFCLSFLAFFLLVLLVFVWPVLRPLSFPLLIGAFILLFITFKTSSHIIFQTKFKFEYLALSEVLITLVFLALLFFVFRLLWWPVSLSLVFACFLLANIVGAVFAFLWANHLSSLEWKVDKEILGKILREAFPTGALLLVFSTYNRLDILLLQSFKGAESVGLYGLAYRIHDNLVLGAAYLTASLYPLLAKMVTEEGRMEKMKMIYRKTFDLLLLAGIFLLVFVFLLSPLIIFLIGGEGFRESTLILRILIFATLFAYFNHLVGYTLIALGKQRISLLVALVALIWNLGFNLIFIPRYSYLAAATITITTEALVFGLTSFYLAKKFSLQPAFTFWQTLTELLKTRGKIF